MIQMLQSDSSKNMNATLFYTNTIVDPTYINISDSDITPKKSKKKFSYLINLKICKSLASYTLATQP